MFQVLDLFSGIGGFALGLERTGGFETVAFCEIDPFCRRVLARHWPKVPCYDDVRTLTADTLRRDGIAVDVICGGFPCQDISFAGKRAGLEGARSGLWGEYRRLVGELRPRFVIVENVPGLLSLGMGTVLGDLSALGYDAVWDCIPASAVGAPHRRDRVWAIAYSNDARLERRDCAELRECPGEWTARKSSPSLAHTERIRQSAPRNSTLNGAADRGGQADWIGGSSKNVANATRQLPYGGLAGASKAGQREYSNGGWWLAEPPVGRVAHGVPSRVDRLKALGNAVVPQIPELIGLAILEAAA